MLDLGIRVKNIDKAEDETKSKIKVVRYLIAFANLITSLIFIGFILKCVNTFGSIDS